MARKTVEYIVKENNRDFGKKFVITEMSAVEGERLSQDLYRTMAQDGFYKVDPSVVAMSCVGLATIGLSVIAAASKEAAQEINKSLLATIKTIIEHEGKQQERLLDPEVDIEEISTLRELKDQVIKLNFGFLTAAAKSNTPH